MLSNSSSLMSPSCSSNCAVTSASSSRGFERPNRDQAPAAASRSTTARAAGIICRRPFLRRRFDENSGFRQALELAKTPCQIFYSSNSSSSCKCRSLPVNKFNPRTRLTRRRISVNLEHPPGSRTTLLRSRIHGGRRQHREEEEPEQQQEQQQEQLDEEDVRSLERSMHSSSSDCISTGIDVSQNGGVPSAGLEASIELVGIPGAAAASSSSNGGSSSQISGVQNEKQKQQHEKEQQQMDEHSGLLVVTSQKFLKDKVKLTIGGAPKYIRLLSSKSLLLDDGSDQAAAAAAAAGGDFSEPPAWELALPHVAVATLASVLFGYHIGVVNVPLQYIAADLGFAGSVISQGLLVSLLLGAAFLGCAVSGLAADGIGRRRSFQLSTVPMIMGAILCAISSSLNVMLAGRFLVGLGLGLSNPLASLYVSEVSPTAVRGAYGSLLQVAGCCGILGSLIAGLPASSIPGWWRVCFWISTGPAILLAVAMQFCAESPRWLFKKQQHAKAETALERLWGSAHVKEGMADLMRQELLETGRTSSWSDLFSRRYSRVVLIGSALFAFQQLAGINAVFYFSSTVFRNAGISSDVYASVCVGVANLLASLIATCFMERQGRRSLLMISFSGMAIAMALQASAAAIPALASVQGTLSVIATLMYVMMFAFGAGPVPGLLLPELFADCIRAKAMSIAMCIHWIFNFIVGFSFLQLLHKLGAAMLYSFFSLVCITAVFFVKQVIVETKGKTLDEIQALLLAQNL